MPIHTTSTQALAKYQQFLSKAVAASSTLTSPSRLAPAPHQHESSLHAQRQRVINTRFQSFQPHFDLAYRVMSPPHASPVAGVVSITLKLYLVFRPFSRLMLANEELRGHRLNPAAADLLWTDAEKSEFRTRFNHAVNQQWRLDTLGFRFVCISKGFEDFSAVCAVTVDCVDDPADAHTHVTIQKMPPDAPLYSAYISSESSLLDERIINETPQQPFPFTAAKLLRSLNKRRPYYSAFLQALITASHLEWKVQRT